MTDLSRPSTLVETRDALHRKSLSAVELIQAAIAACEQEQPLINAFIEIHAESALAAARSVDERLARGFKGALRGVPIAYKDMFDRRGYRSSFGSRLGQATPPAADAPPISRLESAGAVLVGAASMSEFALGPTGHNVHYGPCRNPHDTLRISGGSSSGPAAAVAAGLVAGAIGSDTGGSLRIPAACCGVVGLKPTQRRVSRVGALPLSWSMDCIGPLARTVKDCAVLFHVLVDPKAPPPAHADPAPLRYRVIYPRHELLQTLPDDIGAAIDSAATLLRELGMDITERPLPRIAELHALADVVQKAECAAVHAENVRSRPELFGASTLWRIQSGNGIAAADYLLALKHRKTWLHAFLADTLQDADALLLPTIGLAVPRIDETDENALGPQTDIVAKMTRWTRWVNYLDAPALTVPCGLDNNGLPVGLQLVGRPYEESVLLQIGTLFQDAMA